MQHLGIVNCTSHSLFALAAGEDLGGDDADVNGAADSDDEDLPPLEKE